MLLVKLSEERKVRGTKKEYLMILYTHIINKEHLSTKNS